MTKYDECTYNLVTSRFLDPHMMKLLAIDDHRLFLDGLVHVLQSLQEPVEVTACTSAIDALQILQNAENVDLILVDLRMPKLGGLEFLKCLQVQHLHIPVVVLSANDTAADIHQALALGAVGFIPKSYSSQEMLAALQKIFAGEVFIPENMQMQIARIQHVEVGQTPVMESGLNRIGVTRRQREVLKLVARGYTNKEIAVAMNLSESTVKSHIYTLFKTLHAESRTECVNNAMKIGLIKSPAD